MEGRGRRLEGTVALVTGAGSIGPGVGTGKAFSILFAREGAKLALVDRISRNAEETSATIHSEGGEALVTQGDVSHLDGCRRMVNTAVDRYGRLDILVNNVGSMGRGTALDVAEETWDRVMGVNLKSMMLMSKYAIPRMIEGGGGSIVNVSSLAAWRASPPDALAYSVAKAGVVALTMSMAVAHAREGIRVNCVVPGMINTPMAVAGLNLTEEMLEARGRSTPLGTPGTAWDIAWAGLFLASDEARWVTGVALPVDGGSLCTLGIYQPAPPRTR